MPGYTSVLNDPLLAAISQNTFTGPQDVCSSTTQDPFVMPANTLKAGSKIHTRAAGTFSTTGTPTLVMGPYYGTTVLGVNVALTTASGAATLLWILDTQTEIRGTGTSGVAITSGTLTYGTTLTAVTTIPVPGIALATVAIDTTASTLWTVKATWSASSGSNIIATNQFLVEMLNLTP